MINAVIPKVDTGIKVRTKSRGRSRARIAQPVAIAIPKVDTAVKTRTVVRVRRLQAGKQTTFQTQAPLNFGGGASYYAPPRVPTPIRIPLPTMAGGGRSSSLGNVRPEISPTRYAPSFKALFFKIRGQAPQGRVRTGINFRPITPGFSFTGRKKIIRVRRIRL